MKKLGFGLMRLPLLREGDPQSIDTEQVTKMADYYMSKGFNYFDTAYPYHQGASEKTVRKTVVERYPRESF
jgi:predicted aldo/keto reductase-like oxidoreductase